MGHRDYNDGYGAGQHDLLTLVACRGDCGETDHVLTAIAGDDCALRFRMWCLTTNLTIAAGLCEAYSDGRLAGMGAIGPIRHVPWEPGCGSPAPGWGQR